LYHFDVYVIALDDRFAGNIKRSLENLIVKKIETYIRKKKGNQENSKNR